MFGLSQTSSRVVSLVALACVLVVILLTVAWCNADRGKRQAEGQRDQAASRTVSAADASAIRDAADERKAKIDNDVKEATDAIRNAPDAASRDRAALVGLCRVNTAASPECRMLNSNPR